MSNKRFSLELNFVRLNDLPLPDYRIEPDLHFKNDNIIEANAYYEIFKFVEQFLKLNYIHYNPCESWQRKDTLTLILTAFVTDYKLMLKKLGWNFEYMIGEPQ